MFRGANGGYNATMICGNGLTCDINCFNDACDNLKLTCENENNDYGNCTFEIICVHTEYDSINCPDSYQLPSIMDGHDFTMPSLLNVTMSTYENSYILCNSSLKHCVDFDDLECVYQNINTTAIESPICCSGGYSCQHV